MLIYFQLMAQPLESRLVRLTCSSSQQTQCARLHTQPVELWWLCLVGVFPSVNIPLEIVSISF